MITPGMIFHLLTTTGFRELNQFNLHMMQTV